MILLIVIYFNKVGEWEEVNVYPARVAKLSVPERCCKCNCVED